jgi:hypothetical protein
LIARSARQLQRASHFMESAKRMTSPDVVARFPIEKTRPSEEHVPPPDLSDDQEIDPRAIADIMRRIALTDAIIGRAARLKLIAQMIQAATYCTAEQASTAASRVGLFIVRGEQ